MRNISFFLTQAQYRDGTKTVTRRLNWWNEWINCPRLEPDEVFMGVVKSQGLNPGEKIQRLGPSRHISSRRERLDRMIYDLRYGIPECAAEGFPDLTPRQFVEMFCEHMKCKPDAMVTRIEFGPATGEGA